MSEQAKFKSGDKVFYFGPMGMARTAGVVWPDGSEHVSKGHVAIVFYDGSMVFQVPIDCLQPYRLDFDWGDVKNTVARNLAGWRYILSQKGDDLCWLDFYRVAASMLSGEEAKLANLKSMPAKPLMMRNCDRYTDALLAGKTEGYKACSMEEALKEAQEEIKRLNKVIDEYEEDRNDYDSPRDPD